MIKSTDAAKALDKMVLHFQSQVLERIIDYSRGESFTLHYLLERKSEVLPSEISSALNTSTARIAVLLGQLEQKGLISREVCKSDRRKVEVSLTAAGRKRAKKERDEMHSYLEKVFQEMGEKDTEDFLRTAGRFFEISLQYESECNMFDKKQNRKDIASGKV